MGVTSFVMELDVRTDWLSGVVATTTEGAVGLVVFSDCKVMRAVVIVLTAFQSSSLSLVRPLFGIVA